MVVVVVVVGGQAFVDQRRIVEQDAGDLTGGGGPNSLERLPGRRSIVGGRLLGEPAGRALRRVGANWPNVDIFARLVSGVPGDVAAMLEADITERHLALTGAGKRRGGR